MEKLWLAFNELKPVLVMVMVQTGFAGVNIFYKLATNEGMSPKIISAYRFIFASAFLAPLAYFTERKTRPQMTWTVLFQAFLCGLFGCSLNQIFYVSSLALTSATFTSAMSNLVPAVTFLLAVSFRLEKLALKTVIGKAKVLGTLLGILGAMILTFYKGIEINIFQTHLDVLHHGHHKPGHDATIHADSKQRALGALLALGSCFSYSLWLVVQAKMSKNYPCQLSSTALMSIMAAAQGVVFALCLERDWGQWKLGWNIRLLTVAYGGIVASGLLVLVTWCVRMKGPLYASVFNPLLLVLVAIAGALFLSEKIYLGSVIGAVLIVCGLYVVLWGKSKEAKKMTRLAPLEDVKRLDSINEIAIIIDPEDEDRNNEDKDQSVTVTATMDNVPRR